MSQRFVITATDTGVGKTIFAAALVQALGASYWKPIQAGFEEEADSEVVARLTGLEFLPGTIFPEAYRLTTPASPHLAAEIDGITIDPDALDPPVCSDPLIIEGAGGPLVPVTRTTLFADIFARWRIPVIICARTGLGTINHSLMTIEALRHRNVPILGLAFIGDAVPDSEGVIPALSGVKRLGRLPRIEPLTPDTLAAAFADHFDLADFR